MNKNEETKAKIMLLVSMVIYGTIGIFRRYIPLPSGMIALFRAVIGLLFLLVVIKVGRQKISVPAIRRNFKILCISGMVMGINWILLFEAYRYTSVATATLCYYMEPIFVILASAFLLKEKLTGKKKICSLVAFVGMILVSGVLQVGISDLSELKGIFLGLGAGLLYATVILLNKQLKEIGAYDKTITQLAAAAVVLLPYTLAAEEMSGAVVTPLVVFMMVIVGIVHTGIAYALYFGSMGNLKAQTIALFSYVDPVVAVILSTVLLGEGIGISGFAGAVLILGSTMVSELEGS